MRRSMIPLLIVATIALQQPQRAEAGAALATEFTQILNHAQLALQYLRLSLIHI